MVCQRTMVERVVVNGGLEDNIDIVEGIVSLSYIVMVYIHRYCLKDLTVM